MSPINPFIFKHADDVIEDAGRERHKNPRRRHDER